MKINKPDEAEIRVEHHNLYKGRSQKMVAAASGVSSTVLSRRLDHNETIVKNPIFEVRMEMIGAVESGQSDIAKGIFKMIYIGALELGLVDEQPIDILELAVERLRSIDSNQIRSMSNESITQAIVATTDLEGVANVVKHDLLLERNDRQTRMKRETNARDFVHPRRERAGSEG